MYSDIPLYLALLFMFGGLAALAWSSDIFVDGAAVLARIAGISPFIIGMVIIGFGTSAPELCVSVMSGVSSHADLSLGNAYGSCIFNIAGILGIAALIRPILVKPSAAYVAAPALVGISALSYFLLRDGTCSRTDAFILLAVFAVLMPIYCWYDQREKNAEKSAAEEGATGKVPRSAKIICIAVAKLVVGLAVLVGSSHYLVWGAVDIARTLGVSELLIGLTIVAMGTSLPELASAIASARRGEHEFVLGNIIGSNFFNTLGVVGIATSISPVTNFSPFVLSRDLPTMILFSLSITIFGINFRKPREGGKVTRAEGVLWIALFIVYTIFVIYQESPK
jgi:cation:H+ antiporter